jgi:chromate transporter
MWEQLQLFLISLKSSALAVGGLASLPLLRADLVPQYVTEAGIVQALAIGRLAPGPNGLYIVSLG